MCSASDSFLISRLSQSLTCAISALGHLLINIEGSETSSPQSCPKSSLDDKCAGECHKEAPRVSRSMSSPPASSVFASVTHHAPYSASQSTRELQPLDPALFRRGGGRRRRVSAPSSDARRPRRISSPTGIPSRVSQPSLRRAKSAPVSPLEVRISSSVDSTVDAFSPKRVRFAGDV